MANTKKYVSLDKLGLYDEKIKGVISAGDAAALKSAKDYADSLATNYDAVGTAATEAGKVQAELDKEVARAKAAEEANAAAAKKAQDEVDALELVVDTKAAQADLEALETLVGTLPEGTTAKDVVEYVNVKTAGIATDAALEELQGQLTAAQGAIDAIEEDYLKKADKTELQNNIDTLAGTHATDKDALEASIKAISDNYLKDVDKEELQGNIDEVSDVANAAATKEEFDATVEALEAEDARIAGLVATEAERAAGVEAGLDTRIKAVEDDYLKAADKEELQGNIDTLTGVVETLRDGIDADKVDGVKDLIAYVEEHGTEVTGMKEDIEANADAIEAEVERATGVEAGFETRIKANEEAVATVDTRIATAKSEAEAKAKELDSALETLLKAYADSKVEGVDLSGIATNAGEIETLKGQMTAVEDAVATKVEQEAYNAKIAVLEGADAGQVERIAALEAKFGGAEGSVEDMIADAKQEAIDAAATAADTKDEAILVAAKKYADDEDAKIEERVDALEAASTTHALASDLTALAGRVTTAEGEIDTLQSEMDAVEALAAANKAAHEANAAAILLKASQADLEAVSGRVTTLETWHNNFTEVSEEEINNLFA